ncbi:MAG: DUF423 domain-containing protein [Gammaproteobacteria bacterium]|nr:DUF423 domain-containing protein [Gammaproteobacteria bacterium]
MVRFVFTFAAISGLLSVVLGAFASHGLRGRLDERLPHAFETAVTYQMSHSLALLLTALLIEQWGRHWALDGAVVGFIAGIVLFSGSLYLLALTEMKWLGPVTPLGGLAFIVGWGLLAIGVWVQASS